MTNREERRLAKLRITKWILFEFLKPGKPYHNEYVDGFPEDTQIEGVFIEYQYPDEISLIFSSEKFDPVPLGKIIPDIYPQPTYRRLES